MTKHNLRVTAFAPASVGNIGLGFDLLGAAIQPLEGAPLGDSVSVWLARQDQLLQTGPYARVLPPDPRHNIVWRCLALLRAYLDRHQRPPLPPVAIELHKGLPVGSGLGSSAASIVAALAALNELLPEPLTQEQLLCLMGQAEGEISGSVHYDNVAPSFLGGLQLMHNQPGQCSITIPFAEHYCWLLAYSGVRVSTADARRVLPQQVALETTIGFGQQLALFVSACYRQCFDEALVQVRDLIAEPWRGPLLPGFEEAKTILDSSACAWGISGSGPTLFAICRQPDEARQLQQQLMPYYRQTADGFCHICRLDAQGVRITREYCHDVA